MRYQLLLFLFCTFQLLLVQERVVKKSIRQPVTMSAARYKLNQLSSRLLHPTDNLTEAQVKVAIVGFVAVLQNAEDDNIALKTGFKP